MERRTTVSELCSLARQIEAAVTVAMKAREPARVSALRMLRSALKYREIDKRAPLEDADVVQVLATQAKQRRESIEQFRAASRAELVAKEEAELAVIQEFLPRELSDVELQDVVRQAVAEVGASGPQDLGKVMGALMARVRGRADGKRVNEAVRAALGGGGGR